ADGNLGQLLVPAAEQDRVLQVFAGFPLDPVLAFKLTVAREQMPHIYHHCLQVALCAVVLSMASPGSGENDWRDAAAAGLFHDLGFLHLDSAFLGEERRVTARERQYIYSHPILAELILNRAPSWHSNVRRAALEHHERLDGSGYPRGLSEAQISPLGQLLAVADLVPSLFLRRRFTPLASHVHVILRLNQGKFNRAISDRITALVKRNSDLDSRWTSDDLSYATVLDDLVVLSVDIQSWHSIAARYDKLPVVELINRRLKRLEKNCAGVGIDLQYWGMIDADVGTDQGTLRELAAGAAEARWQLCAIAQEIQRKWKSLCPQHQTVREEIWEWIGRIDREAPALSDA
ncbi:MAG TPA: HD domain-containing phosphohydrolase, partial [Azonexus sp.]|nr:HD domain-containing phosphohydrolase [Azonexus sp.]